MNIPYNELMKYRHQLPSLYEHKVFEDEYAMIISRISSAEKVVDFGCGTGRIYNDKLLPTGFSGTYVGIDNDPTLNPNFKLFRSIDEFTANSNLREYDTLLMLNIIEALTVEETYEAVVKLNPYIDGQIIILTPNPFCFDYMFVDPQHKTFYTHEFLYGLLKHLDFPKIEIWRGKGYHQIREERARRQPHDARALTEINDFQRKVCTALGLDWYGNIMAFGERDSDEEK